MKLYFSEIEDCAYTIDYLTGEMLERGYTEIKVYEAKREVGVDYFWCKLFEAIGDKNEGGCGKVCDSYKPRNGRSGCCMHRNYCYEYGEEFILTIEGKLKPIK